MELMPAVSQYWNSQITFLVLHGVRTYDIFLKDCSSSLLIKFFASFESRTFISDDSTIIYQK